LRSLDEFYRLLDSLKGRYVFKCVKGQCTSFIEIEDEYATLFNSFPGLRLSRKRLSDSILLPPPRASDVRGGRASQSEHVELGIILGHSGAEPVRLAVNDLYRHILIVGSTGAGKTHTAARIARCAAELGINVIVFDWHGEYYTLIGGNELSGSSLPPVDIIVEGFTLEESVSALEYALELSTYQSTLLLAILSALFTSLKAGEAKAVSALIGEVDIDELRSIIREDNTIRGLASAINYAYRHVDRAKISKGESEVWLALIRRLNSIAFSRYAQLFRIKGAGNFFKAIETPLIINLSTIKDVKIRRLYALLLLYKIYSVCMETREPTIVVIDEAHHIIESRTVREIVGEARKYNLGVVASTHTPQLIPLDMMSNFNTIIVHKLTSNKDKSIAAQILGEKELAEVMPKLAPGEAIVKAPSLESNVLVRIDLEKPCIG
jgi:DNA helicase HerA-like ATPase